MSKFGSSSIWFLVDGYDMIANKLQGLSYKITSMTEPTHGIGDSWDEHTPVGLSRSEFTQEGAFFDSSTSGGFLHVLNSTTIGGQGPSSTEKVVCLGVAGNTSGKPFIGFRGKYGQDYEVLGSIGKLTRANASCVVTGNAEHGLILKPFSTGSTSSSLDGLTASTNGGTFYVQVTSINLGLSAYLRISMAESSDSITWADIIVKDTTGTGAWRLPTSGASIEQYVTSYIGWAPATSGSVSATHFIGFSRL